MSYGIFEVLCQDQGLIVTQQEGAAVAKLLKQSRDEGWLDIAVLA